MSSYPLESLSGVTVGQLAWLAGTWRGKTGAGADPIEEHWTEPLARTMVGMFRWVREGKLWFYEILSIEEEPDGLIFRIKHYDAGMKGWEAKDEAVTFHLTLLTENEAVFAKRNAEKSLWMVYRRVDPSTLLAFFQRPDVERKPEDDFTYTRV